MVPYEFRFPKQIRSDQIKPKEIYLILVDPLDSHVLPVGVVGGDEGVTELAMAEELPDRIPGIEILGVAEVGAFTAGQRAARPLPVPLLLLPLVQLLRMLRSLPRLWRRRRRQRRGHAMGAGGGAADVAAAAAGGAADLGGDGKAGAHPRLRVGFFP